VNFGLLVLVVERVAKVFSKHE